MTHTYRFWAEMPCAAGHSVALSADEAHHAARVVRVRAGDRVELFDGHGGEGAGVVEIVSRNDVVIRMESLRTEPPPGFRLTLLQASLHRAPSMEYVIQRGTELGVTRFRFFRAAFSERAAHHSAKWAKIAVEACKQCGRSWAPALETVSDLDTALAGALPHDWDVLIVATADRPPTPLADAMSGAAHVALVIGPEGGLTDSEMALLERHGANPVSLGRHMLRAEAAAATAVGLVLYEAGMLGPNRGACPGGFRESLRSAPFRNPQSS